MKHFADKTEEFTGTDHRMAEGAGAAECNAAGIDAFFPIVRGVTTLDEAMVLENAKENMTLSVEQVFRIISG